jgi:hypothetical protein
MSGFSILSGVLALISIIVVVYVHYSEKKRKPK